MGTVKQSSLEADIKQTYIMTGHRLNTEYNKYKQISPECSVFSVF